jgi:hypothetical protein
MITFKDSMQGEITAHASQMFTRTANTGFEVNVMNFCYTVGEDVFKKVQKQIKDY